MKYELTDEVLVEMVKVIVNEIHPVMIIMFGSRAGKEYLQDSDIDLLIVENRPFSKERSRIKEAAKLWRALSIFNVPKDILLFSQNEVEFWRNSSNHVISKALKEGKILYEAA